MQINGFGRIAAISIRHTNGIYVKKKEEEG